MHLPDGYRVYADDDGDWWLEGPPDVTIVSLPGEPLLIGRCDSEEQAILEAITEIQALGGVTDV